MRSASRPAPSDSRTSRTSRNPLLRAFHAVIGLAFVCGVVVLLPVVGLAFLCAAIASLAGRYGYRVLFGLVVAISVPTAFTVPVALHLPTISHVALLYADAQRFALRVLIERVQGAPLDGSAWAAWLRGAAPLTLLLGPFLALAAFPRVPRVPRVPDAVSRETVARARL